MHSNASPGLLGPVIALLERELKRFARRPARIVGAVGTPVLIWLFLGFGFAETLRLPGAQQQSGNYLTYFFPGMVLMVVVFTSIFSAISVIQDRNSGFLQGVVAAPVSRLAIVLGLVAGGTVVALAQGGVTLLLAPLAGWPLTWLGFGAALLTTAAGALGLSALGLAFAWRTGSIQSFHSVMNLVLFPMWLLSGAFFPPSGWLGYVMLANPLTYVLTTLRYALTYQTAAAPAPAMQPSLAVSVAVTCAFVVGTLVFAAATVRRNRDVES